VPWPQKMHSWSGGALSKKIPPRIPKTPCLAPRPTSSLKRSWQAPPLGGGKAFHRKRRGLSKTAQLSSADKYTGWRSLPGAAFGLTYLPSWSLVGSVSYGGLVRVTDKSECPDTSKILRYFCQVLATSGYYAICNSSVKMPAAAILRVIESHLRTQVAPV